MIKQLIFFLLLLCFSPLKAQQNLGSFVDSSNVWFNYGSSGSFNGEYMRYHHFYYYQGDTLIGSYTYKKMYKNVKDTLFYSNGITPPIQLNYPIFYQAAFRQEGQKVFAVKPDSTNEILYLDFNMQIGDTVKYSPFGTTVKTVTGIDSVLFGNQYRRKYLTTGGVFFEGIGHQYGVFRDNSLFFEGGNFLSCFHQYDETQYVYALNGSPPCYDLNTSPALIITPTNNVRTCINLSNCINFQSNNPAATYSWIVNNAPAVSGIPNTGTGNFCFSNNYEHLTIDTLEVEVRACINGNCGAADTFLVFLMPPTSLNPMPDLTFCNNTQAVNFQNYISNSTQTNWFYDSSSVISGTSNYTYFDPYVPYNGYNTLPQFNGNNNSTINNVYHKFHINSRDVYGCWSRDTFNIIILKKPIVNAGNDTTVCYGSYFTLTGSGIGIMTYQWNYGITNGVGFNIYNSSQFIVMGTDSINGCTNRDTVLVYVQAPIQNVYETASACNSYFWNGYTYYVSGSYYADLINSSGCGYRAYLNLTINNSISNNLNITSCDPYTWNGNTYYTSGVYSVILTRQNGCDSILNLILTINNTGSLTQNGTICAGEFLTVGSSTYNVAGIYTDVLTNSSGCPYTLTTNLIVLDTFQSSQNVTICNGEIYYSILGSPYSSTGIYEEVILSVNGCDSTIITNLTVQQPINVTTTVNNTTITVNETNATFFWLNCANNEILLETSNPSFTVPANGQYAVIVTKNNCSAMSECVTIDNVSIENIIKTTIEVYPNPTTSTLSISGISSDFSYKISDLQGKLLKQGANDKQIDIENLSAGTYVIGISTDNEVKQLRFVKL